MASSIITCNICQQTDDNYKEFGEFMFKDNISVHYYCLLLSTNLLQNGKDNSGILGFLIRDIKREIIAAKSRVCFYCEKVGASIKCAKCKIYFHYICGNAENCVFQFCDEFKSYCHNHYDIKHADKHISNEGCVICFDRLGVYNPVTSIAGPCCKIGWAHRKCIRMYALTAGYYMRCPFCKKKSFRDKIRKYGIFVPDREADWEKEKGAFKYFYETISTCEIQSCECPKGRKHRKQTGNWQIIKCTGCGSSGVHLKCFKSSQIDGIIDDDFKCNVCINIFQDTIQNDPTLSCPISRLENTMMFTLLTHSIFDDNSMLDASKRLPEKPMVKKTNDLQNASSTITEPTQANDRGFQYVLIKDNKIVGFAKGNLKNPEMSDQDSFTEEDFDDFITSSNDKDLDDIVETFLKNKDLKPTDCINVSDSDSENDDQGESVEGLINKIMMEPMKTNFEMPKPLIE